MLAIFEIQNCQTEYSAHVATLLGGAQPVIPPNLYYFDEHNSLGPQVSNKNVVTHRTSIETRNARQEMGHIDIFSTAHWPTGQVMARARAIRPT